MADLASRYRRVIVSASAVPAVRARFIEIETSANVASPVSTNKGCETGDECYGPSKVCIGGFCRQTYPPCDGHKSA